MESAETHQEIEREICWANAPPVPTPGMCYIEPQIKRDFTSFDGSLESIIPKQLHTDLVDALDIDFMKIVMDRIDGNDATQGPEKPIDRVADKGQERRSEALERERIKKGMSEMFDYQKYIQESFDDVSTLVHPVDGNIGVEEVYDLFPDSNEECVAVQSDFVDLSKGSFDIEEEGSSKLFSRANMVDGRVLTCLPQSVNDFLLFHIVDGRAHYSNVFTLYKLQKHRGQRNTDGEKKK